MGKRGARQGLIDKITSEERGKPVGDPCRVAAG